ncbi:hypothetical protein WJX72_002634 [[Myrmecia] bisecta]|uniref:Uncharacterized protein n=1 Tax=[Myrmecia] bisecta TaxID=41462 RepID=A0AAW1QPQ0_9CHLO
MHRTTASSQGCRATLYNVQPADKHCCQTLSAVYGPNSTLPSRNCFCVPDYWQRFNALSTVHRIDFVKYFKTCSALGHPVYYWQQEGGPCNPQANNKQKAGVSPAAAPPPSAAARTPAPGPALSALATAAKAKKRPPQRSLGAWLRGLKNDGLTCLAFTMMLVSATGVSLMAWPFLYDLSKTAVGSKISCPCLRRPSN